jgi:hypothetical protein
MQNLSIKGALPQDSSNLSIIKIKKKKEKRKKRGDEHHKILGKYTLFLHSLTRFPQSTSP